jgi:ankyrin repeat protein
MDFYPPIDWIKHRLHAAAISGNVTEAKRLIADGADVNENLDLDVDAQQEVAGTPLHVALRNCPCHSMPCGHCAVVAALLVGGADVAARRRWAGTPLHDAAAEGLTHIAELLLSHGADVNSRDFYGRTPLHLAAENGRLKMVDYLLLRGAEVDVLAEWNPPKHAAVRVPKGFSPRLTPLQLAAQAGFVAVVRRLLDTTASLDTHTATALAQRSKSEWDDRYDEVISLLGSRASA